MHFRAPIALKTVVLTGVFSSVAIGAAAWDLPLFTSAPEQVLAAASGRTAPDGTDVIVLDLAVSIRFTADGRVRVEKRTVTRVLTASGVKKAATFSAPWAPWRQDRPRVHYRVIGTDGRAHTLDEATIAESGVPSKAVAGLFSDRKILNAPLPGVAVGCVIEGEVVVDDSQTLFPGGQYLTVVLADHADVQHAKVLVEAPKEMRLTVAARRFTSERSDETDSAGIRRITLETDRIAAPGLKTMLPPDGFALAAVQISAGVNWTSLASWYSGIVDKLAGPMPKAAGENTPRGSAEIATTLAAIHKNVRYTGLELGMSSFIPHSPEQTLDHGYGDCKDQAVLLVRDLRKAGFRASVALLTPYPGPDARTGAPGIEVFTHAIVYVEQASPLWLDPSAELSVVSRLPFQDQGRHALIVDAASKDLVTTPENSVDENSIIEDVEIVLAEGNAAEGNAHFQRHSEYRGAMADTVRPAFAEPKVSEAMRKMLVPELGSSAKIDSAASADGSSFTIHASSNAYSHAVTTEETASVSLPHLDVDVGPLGALAGFFAIEAMLQSGGTAIARSEDFYLLSTYRTERHTHIVPPPGYVAKTLAVLTGVRVGPPEIERYAKIDKDGSVRLVETLQCVTRRFSPKDGKAIADALRTLPKYERTKFEFRKGKESAR